MPESVETQGHTVEEAIQVALNQLGTSRDRVDIKILHHPRGGFLGIGARRAKVLATLREDPFRDGQEFDMSPRPTPQRRRRQRGGRGRSEGKEGSGRGDRSRRGRDRDQSAGGQKEPRREQEARKAEPAPQPVAAVEAAPREQAAPTEGATPSPTGDRPRRSRRRRGGRGRGRGERKNPGGEAQEATPVAAPEAVQDAPTQAPQEQAVQQPTAAPEPAPVRKPDPAEVEKVREQAWELISAMIQKMGFEATVEVVLEDEATIVVKVASESEGLLIGRRGQTLDAIEHILNRMVYAGEATGDNEVILDIGGYRERRRQTLHDMATRLRDRSLIEQRSVQISPLGPRDRKVIIDVLGDDYTVKLKTLGTGMFRRIQITPAGMQETPVARGEEVSPDDHD